MEDLYQIEKQKILRRYEQQRLQVESETETETETETEAETETEGEEGCKTITQPQSQNQDDIIATLHADEWITLKLDDVMFNTTRNTLTLDKNSMLSVMFDRESPFRSIIRDESHPSRPYLLDRNPRYFAPLLNYLRTGECVIDAGTSVKGVYLEAKYFNITGLVNLLENSPNVNDDSKFAAEAELSRKDIVKALINNPSGSRLRFQGLNLKNVDLSKLDLTCVNFSKANLESANFQNATLVQTDLIESNLTNCEFTKANMMSAQMQRSSMAGAVLSGCNLVGADLSFANLTAACLRYADLTNANLSGTILRNADITGANLKGAVMKNCVLDGVNRQGANLSMGGVVG